MAEADPSHNVARPLLVVVHPGDALQDPRAWQFCDDYDDVLKYSLACQAGMAREIAAALADGHDAIVIHRGSCSQFDLGSRIWIDDDFAAAVHAVRKTGIVLYGDDLGAVGRFMLHKRLILARPSILVTGAYNMREHGCVARVGRDIEAVYGARGLAVSEHCPSGNLPEDDIWRPGQE